jgi:hypothetical protein
MTHLGNTNTMACHQQLLERTEQYICSQPELSLGKSLPALHCEVKVSRP